MKLYNVPPRSRIRILEELGAPPDAIPVKIGQILNYTSIDGMYAPCTDTDGQIFYVKAWTEVEVIK